MTAKTLHHLPGRLLRRTTSGETAPGTARRPARPAPARTALRSTALAATLGVLLGAGGLVTAPVATAGTQTIVVDLGAPTGDVLHGANGALYGLSDPSVPSDAIIQPLELSTVSQKPEGGTQHPNGDHLTVGPYFFRNGGGDVNVLMQDDYPTWPYDDLGIDDFLGRVDRITRQTAAAPDHDSYIYVPFNEPDWIWYKFGGADDPDAYEAARDRFLADWTTVYHHIRALDPGARIAGPNVATYSSRFFGDFLTYAEAHDVLPDVTTWHELSPDSLKDFQTHFDDYRSLEKQAGVSPIPVNINEYANRRDLSVPGQLVQWVSMFERNKVDADQAYWDAAGNLSDNVVQSNIPNGGWWFFRWYAQLTGRTVQVTPPQANTVDTLQGMAALDTGKRRAQAIVGGTSGDTDVVVRHVDPAVFGSAVNVTVSADDWSGYDGAADAPRTLTRATVRVGPDGTVTVPLHAMEAMSAYRVVLSPAGDGAPETPSVPWSASYEAEDAAITDGEVFTQGTVENANGYATSGTKDVGSLDRDTSKVAFTVAVPTTGDYDLGVRYGNQSGRPATQQLTVDGAHPQTVRYPSTLNWTYRGNQHTRVHLAAGTHTLTLAHATDEVTLDRIDLTAATTPRTRYEATLADTTGHPSYAYATTTPTGTGALVLHRGDTATFDVDAPRDGYYTVASDHTGGKLDLSVHGTTVTTAPHQAHRLFLIAGNNRITARPTTGDTALRSLDVQGSGDGTGIASYEAEDAALGGTARSAASPFASGGGYVEQLGGTADATARFTVRAPSAGRYMLVVDYSNNERGAGHQYNTNIISRAADLTVDDGPAQRVRFHNTNSWEDFWGLGIPVDLSRGTNTITLGNADGAAPDLDRIRVARVAG
ncbi:CBM35 domain-containing protein [Streptomyces odontomachi]|uniref:CBM35 domain-containing protein n=1 Tax=Streptomyces odontomachi TaxID=2944940 RepID=UPI00210BB6EE|nr:CBM35 domain-containing protein [Streptomyces sp. ODS25]